MFQVTADRILIHQQNTVFLQTDFLMGNCFPFVFPAKLFQIMKPPIAAFPARRFVLLIHGSDPLNLRVPVFIEKPYKQLFHRHLGNTVHIQIRQNAGNIVQQNPVAADNIKVLRAEFFLIIVKNIRDPVHRHRGLSRSRHSLDDQIPLRRSSDHIILLRLDRRNDLSKHRRLVSRQILGQKLIVRHHIGIKEILQPVIGDFIGSLSLQIHFKRTFALYRVSTSSRIIFIINRRQRRSPVDHDRFRRLFGNADPPHIIRFLLRLTDIFEINSAKIRGLSRLPAPHQIPLPLSHLRLGIMKHRQRFLVFWSVCLHQIMVLIRQRLHITLRPDQIRLRNIDDFFQLLFLVLPAQPRNRTESSLFLFFLHHETFPSVYNTFSHA